MLLWIVYKYPDVLELTLNLFWKPKAIHVCFVSPHSVQYVLIICYNWEKNIQIKKYGGKEKVYSTSPAKEAHIYSFLYTFSERDYVNAGQEPNEMLFYSFKASSHSA